MEGSNTGGQSRFAAPNRASLQSDLTGVGRGPRLQDDFPSLPSHTQYEQPTTAQRSYASVVASGSPNLQQQVRSNLRVPVVSQYNPNTRHVHRASNAGSTYRPTPAIPPSRAGGTHTPATQSRTGFRPTRNARQRATSATSASDRSQRHCELPDLFYAYKPESYRSYEHDCSLAYKDFHSYIRHSLEKHWNRGNVEREGITDGQFLMARRRVVTGGESLSQHDKQRECWKHARFVLFGISLNHPIPVCDRHVACKAKATEQEKKYKARPIPKSAFGSSPPGSFTTPVLQRRDHMYDIAAGEVTAATPTTINGSHLNQSSTYNFSTTGDDHAPPLSISSSTQATLIAPHAHGTIYAEELNTLQQAAIYAADALNRTGNPDNFFEYDTQFRSIIQETCEKLNLLHLNIVSTSTTFTNPADSGQYETPYTPSSSGTSMTYAPRHSYNNSLYARGQFLEVPGQSNRGGDASSTRS